MLPRAWAPSHSPQIMTAKHHLREGDLLKRSLLGKADPYRSQFSACPINAGHGRCVTGKGPGSAPMPSVGWPACMRAAKRGEGANVITPIGTRRGPDPDSHGRAPAHQVRRNAIRIAKVGAGSSNRTPSRRAGRPARRSRVRPAPDEHEHGVHHQVGGDLGLKVAPALQLRRRLQIAVVIGIQPLITASSGGHLPTGPMRRPAREGHRGCRAS
jgi:hypothetical protein